MGKPAARIGDHHQCPETTAKVSHIGGPVAAGSSSITINGMPAARKGDKLICVGPPDTIKEGSSSVFIDGKPAARMGDGTAHGGQIVAGSANVFIGNAGKSPAASSSSGNKTKTSESKQSESKSESSSNFPSQSSSPQSDSSKNSNRGSKTENSASKSNHALEQTNTAASPQNEPEEVALPISIIPIRYAYDTEFLSNPPPAPYAQDKLNRVLPKITRQLRDGWVYVFDETTKELKEHQINGAVISNGGIHYPEGTTLSLAFSLFQWTPRIKSTLSEQAHLRARFMRRIRCQQAPQKHTSNEEGLDSLADNHVEHQFAHSSSSASGQSDHPLNHVKPAFDSAQWLANATTPDKLVVALDDPYSDLQDLTYPILNDISNYLAITEGDEQTQHKLHMAEVVRNIAHVQLEEKQFPSTVSLDNYIDFEQDLNDYFGAKYAEELLAKTRPNVSPYKMQMTTKAREKLSTKWNYTPDDRLFSKWQAKQSLASSVDWARLNQFSRGYYQQFEKVDAQLALHIDLLCALIRELDIDPISMGIDNQTRQGMSHYLELTDLVVSSLTAAAQHREKYQQPIQRILNEKNLLSLAPYGGSQHLAAAVKQHFEYDPIFVGFSQVSDILNIANNFTSWIEIPEVRELELINKLNQSTQMVFEALKASVTSSISDAFERLLLAIFPITTSKGSSPKRLILMSLWGATVNQFTLKINREYPRLMQDARAQIRDNIERNKALFDQKVMRRGQWEKFWREQLKREQKFVNSLKNSEFVTIVNNDRATQFRNRVMEQAKQIFSSTYKKTKANISHNYNSVGGLNAAIVGLNLLNLTLNLDQLNTLPNGSQAHKKAMQDTGVSALWTLSAIGAVTEAAAKYSLSRSSKGMLQESLRDITQSYKNSASKLSIKMLTRGLAVGSVAGALAGAIDAYRDTIRISDGDVPTLTKALFFTRGTAFGAQSLAFGTYFVRAFILNISYSTLVTSLIASTMFWAPIVILVASFALIMLEKSPLQKWLLHSSWGTNPKNWGPKQELYNYYKLLLQPKVELVQVHYTYAPDYPTYPNRAPIRPEYSIVKILIPDDSPPMALSLKSGGQIALGEYIRQKQHRYYQFRVYSSSHRAIMQLCYEHDQNLSYLITLSDHEHITVAHNEHPPKHDNALIIVGES
ncbi:PAAR domain-containing protein [Vibrio sp. 10N]|uniref:PAAR domain-containing protein n=1 Tax=Vibrio sp. 10N TaxID=3058938 RepID=UPI002813693A|nr:type VI secretion system toxin VasX [Vibrio sp. 10N]